MKQFIRHCVLAGVYGLLVVLTPWSEESIAGPGAHGPSGEHLDQAATTVATSGPIPRFEAASETFELVATLAGGELSIMLDRFETNVPVLDARLEVESGGRKAQARFHADHGDYAVDDPALIGLLSTPGEHALVVSIVAGQESDLLTGTLAVSGAGARSREADSTWRVFLAYGAAGIVLATIAFVGWRRLRRRRPRRFAEGHA